VTTVLKIQLEDGKKKDFAPWSLVKP